MPRSGFVIGCVLVALTACSDPTYPVIPCGACDDVTTPTLMKLNGTLEMTADAQPGLALRLGGSLVRLVADEESRLAEQVGKVIEVSGWFEPSDGFFHVQFWSEYRGQPLESRGAGE